MKSYEPSEFCTFECNHFEYLDDWISNSRNFKKVEGTKYFNIKLQTEVRESKSSERKAILQSEVM